ncbi:MAG: RNA methyltransferase [Bacillota bacterium]
MIVTVEITSRHNPRIQEVRKLKRRKHRLARRLFLLEGVRSVEEAVDAGARVCEVLVTPHLFRCPRGKSLYERLVARGARVVGVTDEVLASVSDTETPQGIVAVVDIPDQELYLGGNPLVIVADGISDPGNLGTLVRSAAAFGFAGVVLSGGTVDVYNPKCVRATMGSVFRIPIKELASVVDAISFLKGYGLSVVAADARAEIPCHAYDFTSPSAILVGNEARGLSCEALELCDARVQVPMPGSAESLNVGAAAAVLMYEMVRQREEAKGRLLQVGETL